MAPSLNATPSRRLLWGVLSGAVLIGLAIAFIDRPAAIWAHEHTRDVPVFVWFTHLVDPILPAAVVILAIAAWNRLRGRPPSRWLRAAVACSLAAVIAVVFKDQLKYACGRLWPETWTHNNPSWIGNGAYGFFPFHGGEGWQSFPSGHMTRISAVMAVLWQLVPRWRWLWGSLVLLVALGLFGADFHFVGDMIAGVYLGTACAVGVVCWMEPRR